MIHEKCLITVEDFETNRRSIEEQPGNVQGMLDAYLHLLVQVHCYKNILYSSTWAICHL